MEKSAEMVQETAAHVQYRPGRSSRTAGEDRSAFPVAFQPESEKTANAYFVDSGVSYSLHD